MLIAVVIVFLLCQVPSIVDNVFLATLSQQILNTAPYVKVYLKLTLTLTLALTICLPWPPYLTLH